MAAETVETDGVRPRAVPWFAVVAFFVIACGLAWLVALPLWLSGQGLRSPFTAIVTPVMMFTPLAAALLVVFFIQRPRPARIAEYLGIWPLRPAKRTVWMTVAALFGAALLVIAGTFLAAALGLIQLDLVHFSGFRATLEATSGTAADSLPVGALVAVQLIVLPFAAIIPNSLLTIGEEFGWRGWLLPTLRPLGTWPALLITGAIWGFWHAPLILLGYNFAQPNLYGLGLMIVASMLLGVLIGWLRLRTASVWPCVIAHGAINAAAGFAALVIAKGSSFDPVSAGPLGWATWIVMAVVILALIATGQFKKQPRLTRRPPRTAITRSETVRP